MDNITVITRKTPLKDRGFAPFSYGGSKGQIQDTGSLQEILTTFEELKELGLSEFITEEEHHQILNDGVTDINANVEVLNMLLQDDTEDEHLMHITFEELMRLPYFRAYKAINKFPMIKRIEMLQALDTVRSYTYSQISKDESGLPREERITVKQYQKLWSQLKHLEILLAWLYGINN